MVLIFTFSLNYGLFVKCVAYLKIIMLLSTKINAGVGLGTITVTGKIIISTV